MDNKVIKLGSEILQDQSKTRRKILIIRIIGKGQYMVDKSTLKKIYKIDSCIMSAISKNNITEYKIKLIELVNLVENKGKKIDPVIMVPSDLIIPNIDLSIQEIKKLLKKK